MNYNDFIRNKSVIKSKVSLDIKREDIHDLLFDYQKDIVYWAVKRGKAAIFAMTGMGKTLMQLEYARQINRLTGEKVLLLAPLAVAQQTIEEAEKLGISINDFRDDPSIHDFDIINYEQLHKIELSSYGCVILDESSILKNYSGKLRNQIIDTFKEYDYKLACTATPSPNDYMELGNHSELLDELTRKEMLSMFFLHDSGDTAKWRLKMHAEDDFWHWIASWAVVITKPSDLGYDDEKYKLPKLNIEYITVKTNVHFGDDLFKRDAETLQERRESRKMSLPAKIEKIKEMSKDIYDSVLYWCDYNLESEMIKDNIPDVKEIAGATKDHLKSKYMIDFAKGDLKRLVTKPKIAGFGMNWQVCNKVFYVGLSDSYEQFFQSVRRCYRFGQKREVFVYIVISDVEGNVRKNIEEKEKKMFKMLEMMTGKTKDYVKHNINNDEIRGKYNPIQTIVLPKFIGV